VVDMWLKYWNEKALLDEEHKKAAYGSKTSQESRFKAVSEAIKNQSLVLDIGCGTGCFEEFIAKASKYHVDHIIGIDFSESMVKQAKEKRIPNAEFLVLDGTETHFKDRSIPCTVIIGLLQNCDKPYAVIDEATRITDKILVIDTLSKYADYKNPVNTYFDPEELKAKLSKSWSIVSVYGINTKTGEKVPVSDSHAILLVAENQ